MIELVLTNDWLSSSGHWHDPIHYECMQSHSVLMGIHCLICHLIIFIWNKSNFYILTESMIWIKHIENNFYAKWNVYMFWAHLCTKEDFIFTSCISDRSDQVLYFMAPFCSTCSLFTFVCVCFTNCSINYSGRLIVLLTRSPKIIPTQDPHEDLKKERKQKHTIMTIVGQKSRLNIQTSLKCVEARQCYA